MSITSLLNSTFIPLNSNSTWTGAIETTNSHVTILSTIVCDTSCILNVYQSSNGVDIDFTDTFNILADVETNILQIQIKSKWFHISINNNSFTNQTYLRLITKLLAVQDTNISATITGDVHIDDPITEINSATIASNTNTTNTGLQLLHTDLTSTGIKVLTMPTVTETNSGTINTGIASINTNLTSTGIKILTMPTVTETNSGTINTGIGTLHTDLTSTGIKILTMPTVTETNSGTINTGIGTLHTDLTSTGIKVATMPTVSYLGYRNINVGITGSVVKASAGIVQSVMVCVTSGNKYCYLKLYNKATTPTASDTPFITIPFLDNSSIPLIVPLYNYQFSSGLGIRGTDNIADSDNTAPAGVMVTFISYI